MVGHGGFGTTLGALLAGVPQVVVPLFADQPSNAERIAAIGAGLDADCARPATIRAAVERCSREPRVPRRRGAPSPARRSRCRRSRPPVGSCSSSSTLRGSGARRRSGGRAG